MKSKFRSGPSLMNENWPEPMNTSISSVSNSRNYHLENTQDGNF